MNDTYNNLPKCIVIAGPTAGGKTALSVKLALALEAEVINADSMQVYRGMDIGTAKPTETEKQGIPHHLMDVVAPDEAFNAAMFRDMALPLISEIGSRGKVCLVTGGTGLYIKSMTQGLFHCPPSDPELRESLNAEYEENGLSSLYERLKGLDPVAAHRIHPNDRVRILRALEIVQLTEQRPSDMMAAHDFSDKELNTLKICLDVDREILYRRINERSLDMVQGGLIAETEHLLSQGYSADLKPMGAIGYRHMINYLNSTWTLDEAVERLQTDTRRYAKRQLTWFKADPEYEWYRPESYDVILKRITLFLNN